MHESSEEYQDQHEIMGSGTRPLARGLHAFVVLLSLPKCITTLPVSSLAISNIGKGNAQPWSCDLASFNASNYNRPWLLDIVLHRPKVKAISSTSSLQRADLIVVLNMASTTKHAHDVSDRMVQNVWNRGNETWSVELDERSSCLCEGEDGSNDPTHRVCTLFGGHNVVDTLVLMGNLRCPPILASTSSPDEVLPSVHLRARHLKGNQVKKQWLDVIPCDVHAQPLFFNSMPTIELLPPILEREYEKHAKRVEALVTKNKKMQVVGKQDRRARLPLGPKRKTNLMDVSKSMHYQLWRTSPMPISFSTMHFAQHYKRVGWAANLLSWADFHFALGVDALILYTQDESVDRYVRLFSTYRPKQRAIFINFHLRNWPPTDRRASLRGQVRQRSSEWHVWPFPAREFD